MAKRFTDSEKWRDRWVRRLSKDAKLLWFYLCDACDHAGFWERDEELLEFQLGGSIDFEACLAELGGRVLASPDGRVLFLTKFIVFQYGELSPDCRPHKRILETIAHWEEKGYPIGYSKGIYTFKDKEKDKDRTKTKTKGESEGGQTGLDLGAEIATPPPLRIRLGKLFNRRATTKWSAKEEQALKAIEPLDEEDLATLETFYGATIPDDQDYRRRNLETLLNNFGAEVGKARRWIAQHQKHDDRYEKF